MKLSLGRSLRSFLGSRGGNSHTRRSCGLSGWSRRGAQIRNRRERAGGINTVVPLIDMTQIEGEAQQEEGDREVFRQGSEHVVRVCAKRCFGHAAAKRRADATVCFGLLHEHDQDQKNRDENEDEGKNPEENTHSKGREHQTEVRFVNAGMQTGRTAGISPHGNTLEA